MKEECLFPQEIVSLEALLFLSVEKKWPENTVWFCPLHYIMDEEALWFPQGLRFNSWAKTSEIGCCCCLPFIVHLEVWTIIGFCRTPQNLQVFLSSATWRSFRFAFSIVMGIMVWAVQLSYIENVVLDACVNYLLFTEL